ncbi:MAG: hypothetical protein KA140_01120 [Caldisericia bacterium]|nr:hypothetical protein [Caldisericia bacterium]
MPFDLQSEYDAPNNICIVKLLGSPETIDDIEKLVELTAKLWTKDHKVYSITDISKLDFAKFLLIDTYQKKIMPYIKEKVVMGVSVSPHAVAGMATRMFNIVSGSHIVVTKSIEEAYEAIKKQQATSGVFVPLDK